MADLNLTQEEADKLMAMEKCAVDEGTGFLRFPVTGLRFL
jgi:hypothetical protein